MCDCYNCIYFGYTEPEHYLGEVKPCCSKNETPFYYNYCLLYVSKDKNNLFKGGKI